MTRIAIDLNVRVRGNLTYSGFEDIEGERPDEGAPVRVHEPESGLVGTGRVIEVDKENELIYLEVDWASLGPQTLPLDWFMHTEGVFVLVEAPTCSFAAPSLFVAPSALAAPVGNGGGRMVGSLQE